jgi:1,4-alpha-glucan branching enzyme
MCRKPSPWKLLALACLVFSVAFACRGEGAPRPTPPLGATPGRAGATFRVWAPFAEAVAVKVNDGQPVSLKQEDEKGRPEDAVWAGTVPGARAGDRYRYVMRNNGKTGESIDPRARRLTGGDCGTWGVIVDTGAPRPPFRVPAFSRLVIYELHIGTFHVPAGKRTGTFVDAVAKLDYLKDLGVNAVEVMPVHENARLPDHQPPAHNWGYDAVQLYAVNSPYGTPEDFKKFVKECHDRGIAVILDVVYNHLYRDNLLLRFGGASGDGFKDGVYFYGDDREETGFGPRPDFGRVPVRDYIKDNALMWLRDYGVDGLRWDSTINIRAYEDGKHPIPEGELLLRKANEAYRSSDPKQPDKISIAEDLRSHGSLTEPTADKGGFGFNSQWDDGLWRELRKAVFAPSDEERDIEAVKKWTEMQVGGDAFGRVNYSENHDKVGHPGPRDLVDGQPQIRLPALIDKGNPESVQAKRRSTLAAAVVLTSPGIPMLFQGQEMLETRTFEFAKAAPLDWKRPERFPGIVRLYRDLIALRRNVGAKTGGLTGPHVKVFHADGQKVLAYHRHGKGGPGDDVIVVVNLSNRAFHPVNVGFPRAGRWVVRFNSGAAAYDREFTNGDSPDLTAREGAKDGLRFNGDVGIGPYSVIILSQD